MKTLIVPDYVAKSFDPLVHTTQEHVWWLVLHELDLYEESEASDIKDEKTANLARDFIEKYLPNKT